MIRFVCNDTATTEIYTLSLHDALPIFLTSAGAWLATGALTSMGALVSPGPASRSMSASVFGAGSALTWRLAGREAVSVRSEEHTSELQSRQYLVCRLLLEKKKIK